MMKREIYFYVQKSKLFFEIGYVTYEWRGEYGTILVSKEKNTDVGTVRMIGDVLFYANLVLHNSWPKKNHIEWTTVEKPTPESIKEIKRALVGRI